LGQFKGRLRAAALKTRDGWLLIIRQSAAVMNHVIRWGDVARFERPDKSSGPESKSDTGAGASYENEGWKAGVVYPCGAVVIDDRLFVYYGGLIWLFVWRRQISAFCGTTCHGPQRAKTAEHSRSASDGYKIQEPDQDIV